MAGIRTFHMHSNSQQFVRERLHEPRVIPKVSVLGFLDNFSTF
jgi:hypothetical protein